MYNKGKEGSSQNQSHKGARDVFALKKNLIKIKNNNKISKLHVHIQICKSKT